MTELQEKPLLFSMEHAFHGHQSQHPLGVNSKYLQVEKWNLGRADDDFPCVRTEVCTSLSPWESEVGMGLVLLLKPK